MPSFTKNQDAHRPSLPSDNPLFLNLKFIPLRQKKPVRRVSGWQTSEDLRGKTPLPTRIMSIFREKTHISPRTMRIFRGKPHFLPQKSSKKPSPLHPLLIISRHALLSRRLTTNTKNSWSSPKPLGALVSWWFNPPRKSANSALPPFSLQYSVYTRTDPRSHPK